MSTYSLNSTKTAVAIILPPVQSPDVNAIRRIHDKAFHKWPPHINILYPSVTVDQLKSALPLFRESLLEGSVSPMNIKADRIGTFRHHHNATVFLEPDDESQRSISLIRNKLLNAIGAEAGAGPRDGQYRSHMSLGQASLSGGAVESLVDKCLPLSGLRWEVDELAVLTRLPSGVMDVVDHISFAPSSTTPSMRQENHDLSGTSELIWGSCFAFEAAQGWRPFSGPVAEDMSVRQPISVMSYNLLTDVFGCAFETRLPLIIEALESVASLQLDEVLCLQEVSSKMLADLLAHPFFQHRFPFASHNTDSLLVNHLNLVTLSTKPFSIAVHNFEERHKSALLIRPEGLPYQIANIHLTAALKDHTVAAKQRQILSLSECLKRSTRGTGRMAIIAGDFNVATSDETIEDALREGDINFNTAMRARHLIDPDVWVDAYLSHESNIDDMGHDNGATFDIQRNPLASESRAPVNQRPQRYDRVLFAKDSKLHVADFRLFGFPNLTGHCGSDHFGIATILQPLGEKPDVTSASSEGHISIVSGPAHQPELEVMMSKWLPSTRDREQRALAFTRFTEILGCDARLADIAVVPLGSQALGVYLADSDIDVLVVGSLPSTAFFTIAMFRLGRTSGNHCSLHYINAMVPIIEAEILGMKFDVQYCQAPSLLLQASDQNQSLTNVIMADEALVDLHPSTLRPLNTYRDAVYMSRSIQCVADAFQSAHRFLSLFLRRRGLYSAKFGYLGGVHLTLMLNHLFRRLDSGASETIGAHNLVRTFVNYYARFQWHADIVCDPMFPHPEYHRTPREAIVILAVHSPTARPNVASSCTRLSSQTVTRELALLEAKLLAGDWHWPLRCTTSCFQDFVHTFNTFVITHVDMWDLRSIDQSAQHTIIGKIESRTPALMVQLGRVTSLYAQAWPFQLVPENDEVEEGEQLKVCYVIGILVADKDIASRKLAQSKVIDNVRKFEAVMQSLREYDPSHMWIQVNVQSRKKLIELSLQQPR